MSQGNKKKNSNNKFEYKNMMIKVKHIDYDMSKYLFHELW